MVKPRHIFINSLKICLFILLCVSCKRKDIESSGTVKPDSIARQIQARQDSIIISAERFALERENGYTKVTIINPWQGAESINQVYYLVPGGNEVPGGIDPSNVIFVPVKKIICMSTTHLAMISALNEQGTIAAVSGAGFIYDKDLAEKAAKGIIPDIGYESGLNKELIIRLHPDLLMMYGIGNESAGHVNKIRELGCKTIFNADYLETDPLAKAEWIKLFGALYCKERMADSLFRKMSEDYIRIRNFIHEKITYRPKVMLGLPYKDTWFISPGNSYISRIISDAGGDYLWKDTKSSFSMPYGIENVYTRAILADYWLNIGSAKTKDEIPAFDPRLAELPCFRQDNLFNNNRRLNENGGNDYWESGSIHPDILLKDIVSILHPGLFSNSNLYYYRKLK